MSVNLDEAKDCANLLMEIVGEPISVEPVREIIRDGASYLISLANEAKALREELSLATKTIYDLQQESEAFRLGHQRAIAMLLEIVREYRGKNMPDIRNNTVMGRVQAANFLIEEVLSAEGLNNGETYPLLPPDELQRQNDVMREALERIARPNDTGTYTFDELQVRQSVAQKALEKAS